LGEGKCAGGDPSFVIFGGYGRGNNKITEEGRVIDPKKGISSFLKMKGRFWMEINFHSFPRRWGLLLRCRAEGEAAAKGLVTCQTPASSTPNYTW
jgi:hypothetical protein